MRVLRSIVLGTALCAAAATAVPAMGHAVPKKKLYVSLGDSYASGYQVKPDGSRGNTRNGFAYQVPRLARARGHRLQLVDFGCGGETSASLLRRRAACRGPAVGGPRYAGRTQIAAAERFLRANRGRVALITVSIGGNDVISCVRTADPVPCVAAAIPVMEANVAEIARRLRAAAGPKVRIVGVTYPDVILGQWTGPDANQDLARLSVTAFKLINPALARGYEAAGGRLVDVTAASGAYGSLEELVTTPYGNVLPRPVADVCRLTYYCQYRDIHARTNGYRLIAELIVGTLPQR